MRIDYEQGIDPREFYDGPDSWGLYTPKERWVDPENPDLYPEQLGAAHAAISSLYLGERGLDMDAAADLARFGHVEIGGVLIVMKEDSVLYITKV